MKGTAPHLTERLTMTATRTATDILAEILAEEVGNEATEHITTTASGAAVVTLPETDDDAAAGVRLYLDDTDIVVIGLDGFHAVISEARFSGRQAERHAHLIVATMIADSLASYL